MIKNLTITFFVLILLTAFSFSAKADGFCEIILNQSFIESCDGMDTHDTSDDIIAYNIDAAVLDGGPSNMYHVYDGGVLLATFSYGTGGQTFNIAADDAIHTFELEDVDDATCTYTVTSALLASCSPTCSDGMQNGDETGTDCGGALCEACPCDLIPTNHSVVMTSPTTAFFDWDDMAGADFYQVWYRDKGEENEFTTSGSSLSQKSLNVFQNKKFYQYKLRARCADGTWSDFTEVITFYSSQCDVPTGVSVTFTDLNRMRVRWDANPDEIKAKIRYRPVGTTEWITQNSQDGQNFLWVNGLPSGSTIQYKVRSNCDGNDWSAYSSLESVVLGAPLRESQVISETTLSPNPANEVLNLSFNTIDASEVTITISDNLGKAVVSINNTYQEGTQRETMDISRLAKGYYFVSVRNGEKVETMKFIKL
jgi:hypothetical protein